MKATLRDSVVPKFVGVLGVVLFAITTVGKAEVSARDAAVPHRIVTIAPNSAEIVCGLGACDRIVGVSKFCVHPPELHDRPRVGGLFDPDLEKIVALRPDLVVIRGRIESLEALCKQRGIAVYHDETDTLAGVTVCVMDLGKRLGLMKEAATLNADFRRRLQAIRRRVADRPKPRVLLTLSRQPDRLANVLTAGRGSFLDEMLEIAGGKNVFGHLEMRYPQVSAEGIVAHRPDVIIEFLPEVTLTPELRRAMLDQWRKLGSIGEHACVPAVANGRIHFLTDDHALIPSPRYVEIIDKVSRILHPDADR